MGILMEILKTNLAKKNRNIKHRNNKSKIFLKIENFSSLIKSNLKMNKENKTTEVHHDEKGLNYEKFSKSKNRYKKTNEKTKDISTLFDSDDIATNSDDECTKWISTWCEDWKRDLVSRHHKVSDSAMGRRKFNDYLKTMKNFQYLFKQLKLQTLAESIKSGIRLMIESIKERNYINAEAILLNVIAIGNAPWPIGVTQVGIHTKSAAREKISTTHMNKNAAAHIMGDEATRKYLHGLKRLLTVIQRLFPTNPSQCSEFDSEIDATKGTIGCGSLKLALLETEHNKEILKLTNKKVISTYDDDGSIKIPDSLSQLISNSLLIKT